VTEGGQNECSAQKKEWCLRRPTCDGLPRRRQQWWRSERKAGSGAPGRMRLGRLGEAAGGMQGAEGPRQRADGRAGIAALRRRCWRARGGSHGEGLCCAVLEDAEALRREPRGAEVSRGGSERDVMAGGEPGHSKRAAWYSRRRVRGGRSRTAISEQRTDGKSGPTVRRQDAETVAQLRCTLGSYIKRVRCPGKIKPPLGGARPCDLARNSQGRGRGE
jgi:hypothetical protein